MKQRNENCKSQASFGQLSSLIDYRLYRALDGRKNNLDCPENWTREPNQLDETYGGYHWIEGLRRRCQQKKSRGWPNQGQSRP